MAQRSNRLMREIKKLTEEPPAGISVFPKENQPEQLEAQIIGPKSTPYENGIFHLEILVPDRYPFVPPSLKFLTKVYHPNIDDNGRICLDLIKMPPKGEWRPTYGIENLLVAVRMLLENPNPDDPLMVDIAKEYVSDRCEFEKNAREYCEKHAKS